ncbi:hypothetical protein OCJ37_14375 [Xanthomonas sp. AM6]|uniref:hypothetical protein n=1 Tax=Xanthomonas sp. AM6 TaxID=2982531 RepID=UPI0021DA4839|nr:hypothetical protein [Xanthomonas sp. AM6]UYB51172.1 hypothetical protein OCJ37_14375 [Xanthomonas sp. AM6]
MQLDTFGVYVRRRLEQWGEEFCLARDCEYLGHQSKNMLQILIEHRGEMPARPQGYAPLFCDPRAQEIESIVASIARDNIGMSCSLRAYYCGSGRRKVERYDTAVTLMANCRQRPVSMRQYLTLVELGFQRVRGRLEGWVSEAA